MAQFTKGPWFWALSETGTHHRLVNDSGSVIIDDGSAGGEYETKIDVEGADAALIAAAPDMYEALKRVVENKWEPDKYHMAVIDALRKAEGGK